jgi:hypothetical protein
MRTAAGNDSCYVGFMVLMAVATKSTAVWVERPYTSKEYFDSIFSVKE